MKTETIPTTGATRARLPRHRAAIVWLTGLSAAGKTTLATALRQHLLDRNIPAAVVDGDALRTGLSKNLGFSPPDRRENIRRAGELALALADAGLVVIAALISPFRGDRAMVAKRAEESGIPFAEVYINAPLAVCEQRDPKGLYLRARCGKIVSFTGLDAPYEPPLSPRYELRTDLDSIDQSKIQAQ